MDIENKPNLCSNCQKRVKLTALRTVVLGIPNEPIYYFCNNDCFSKFVKNRKEGKKGLDKWLSFA